MKWKNPEHIFIQGYPVLRVTIDGQTTNITAEQKKILADKGIIFIGSRFSNYTVEVQGQTLVGFVQNEDFYQQIMLPFFEWVKDLAVNNLE